MAETKKTKTYKQALVQANNQMTQKNGKRRTRSALSGLGSRTVRILFIGNAGEEKEGRPSTATVIREKPHNLNIRRAANQMTRPVQHMVGNELKLMDYVS